jgi:hypothetical protein
MAENEDKQIENENLCKCGNNFPITYCYCDDLENEILKTT